MKCLAKRLIASSRVVQLIFVDPILFVVTAQTISVEGKCVAVRGKVVAAAACGRDRIIVLSADGVLHLYDLELHELASKTVGLPGEWDNCDRTVICTNTAGDVVAFGQKDKNICAYSLSATQFDYIGRTAIPDDTISCRVTNGLPGAPGLLLIFSGTIVKVIEISPMMPTVSTVRISRDPVQFVFPLTQDGDCLLITQTKVKTFAIRDVLIGKFEFPEVRLPSPVSAASSTKLKSGVIHNMIICGGKLYELIGTNGDVEPNLISRSNESVNFANVEQFFAVSGAGLWLIHWYAQGTRGRLMINEDNHITELDPEYELDFDSTDFIVDTSTSSNSLIGFGKQPNIDIISGCIPLKALIEPLKANFICDILYEPQFQLLFAVYPEETSVFHASIDSSAMKLRQISTLEGQALAVGTHMGLCICVLENALITIAQYSLKLLDSTPLEVSATKAVIGGGKVIICTRENNIKSYNFNDLNADPLLLVRPETAVTFLRMNGYKQLVYGTCSPSVVFYDIEAREVVDNMSFGGEIAHDVAFCKGTYYIGYRDGTVVVHNNRHGEEKIRRIKLGNDAISFTSAGGDYVIAHGKGVWVLHQGGCVPVVRGLDKRHESFTQVTVAGACIIPYLNLTLVIAYNNSLYMLSTDNLESLLSRPEIISLSAKDTITKVHEGARFRVWIVTTIRELLFYDIKHRVALKLDSDISAGERITAATLWNIELEGVTYTHLAIATTKSSAEKSQYYLRSCSIKRERNSMVVRKRLKHEVPVHIQALVAYEGRLLAASANRLLWFSVQKGVGVVLDHERIKLEGHINDISTQLNHAVLSTTKGLVKVDLSNNNILTDIDNMVNRMRNCICHLECDMDNQKVVLCAQKDCFLNVLELVNDRWRVVDRIDSAERILRMHRIYAPSVADDAIVIVALTTGGSFIEIKFGGETLECGPYLF